MTLINLGTNPNDGTGDSRRLAGQKLNAFIPLIIKSASLATPPVNPSINDRYIIPAGATDDWADKVGAIACYQQSFWNGTSWDSNGGWMTFSAETGMTATLETDDSVIRFDGSNWLEILPSGGIATANLVSTTDRTKLDSLTTGGLGALATRDTVGTDQIEVGAVTGPKIPPGVITNEHWASSAENIGASNWDDVVTNGLWMGSSTANNPLGSDSRWWIGQVVAYNPLYVTQELWDFTNSSEVRHYRRYRHSGTWRSWEQVSGGTILAWAIFDATGSLTLIDDFNVSAISDNGTGDFTIHFTRAMPKTTYGLMGSVASNSTNSAAMPIVKASSQSGTPVSKTVNHCRILVNHYASANVDRSEIYVAFIG